MARGRLVATSIATDKRLNSLSLESEWLFLKTIPHLDRDGLILGDACLLVARVCPRRPEALAMADALIAEWLGAGLVLSYECEDGRVLFFPGFAKNQDLRYDRERASELPPPPGWERTEDGLVLIETTSGTPAAEPATGDNQQNPELVRSNAGVAPEEIPYYIYNYKEDLSLAPACEAPPEPQPETPRPAHRPPPIQAKESNPVGTPPGRSLHFKSEFMPKGSWKGKSIPAGTGQNAVQVYYERFPVAEDTLLSEPQQDDLVKTCTDLNRLREVVTAYERRNYPNRRNVQLILDWYRDGIPQHKPVGDRPSRQALREYNANLPLSIRKGKHIRIPEAAL